MSIPDSVDLCGACETGDHIRHVPEFFDDTETFTLPCQCSICTEAA